jgi:hypothetical protein
MTPFTLRGALSIVILAFTLACLVPSTTFAAIPTESQSVKGPVIEVAFVLDTTGSMSGLIEGAKQKIWSIASKIATGSPTPELRVGLVGYRDKGDDYVTRNFDLTDDLDAMYEHLQAFHAAGGGDTPEHVGRALGEAVRDLSWSTGPKVLKMIYLVGDAPPQTYGDGWNYKTWARNAIAKDIMVNTVRCGTMESTRAPFKAIADLADGRFTTIDASGGMVAVATPFDDEIAEVNRGIGSTTLYAGQRVEVQKAERKKANIVAMQKEAAADRASFMRRSGKSAAKGGYMASAVAETAVQDLTAEPEAAASYSEAELPEPLKGLTAAEKKAKLAEMAGKRKGLETRLTTLSKQRSDYIAKKVSEKGDSFDAEVVKTLREKARKIGVTY